MLSNLCLTFNYVLRDHSFVNNMTLKKVYFSISEREQYFLIESNVVITDAVIVLMIGQN